MKDSVVLKPGKEKPILNRHHWIFSGAVQSFPHFEPGACLPVHASDGRFLGTGYFNRKAGIAGRMLAFDATPPQEAVEKQIESAWRLRQTLFNPQQTNAYRLVNGEGDGLPGLIIDVYDRVFVLQSSTLGMDRLKASVVEYLKRRFQPEIIYEKSMLPTRKEEGLQPVQGLLYGSMKPTVSFRENGIQFEMNLETSQKTGFFLDHREMRQWMGELANGKRVLNTFCYTGGFSLYALAQGAKRVDSVDISQEAVDAARRHVELNGYAADQHGFLCADVFTFLRDQPLDYDLIILDPPAFAKKQKDVVAACRGYKDINRIALQKMPPQSLLLTCSCSHHVDEALFQTVVFQAASEAKRSVRIIGRHRLAPDHPINIFHPESSYLKSLLLYVE